MGLKMHGLAAILLLFIIFLGIILAPFNKVEESFNIQACHDLLFYGSDLVKYDHFKSSGVVPRTFVGALYLSLVVKPAVFVASKIVHLDTVRQLALYLVRGALGGSVFLSYLSIANAAHLSYGRTTSTLYLLITASQFHSTFWASRTLPNMFAFALVNFVWNRYLLFINAHSLNPKHGVSRNRYFQQWTGLLVFTTVIFRSELLVLMTPMHLLELWQRSISFWRTIKIGLICGVASLAITIVIDSYFWQQPLMIPELQVLLFNVYHNQSHLWGTSPFHAYFTTHLPKILLWVLPCSMIEVIIYSRLRKPVVICTCFVLLYSFLPHKEWRFIIYVIPMYNLAAAILLTRWIQNFHRGRSMRLFVVGGALLASMMVTIGMTFLSSNNYPGGDAVMYLNHYVEEHSLRNVTAHLDNLTCQTGANLFLNHEAVTYDKTLVLQDYQYHNFDFLLTESENVAEIQSFGFETIKIITGFDRVDLKALLLKAKAAMSKVPLSTIFVSRPKIYILRKMHVN